MQLSEGYDEEISIPFEQLNNKINKVKVSKECNLQS